MVDYCYQAIGRVQPVLPLYVLVDGLLRGGILFWRHEGFATEIMRWTKWVHESMKVLISKLAVTSNVRVSLFFCQEISVHWNHISHSLRSKRFRFSVSEQRKIEERDSRFWPREKWNESQKHGNACYAGYISYGGPQGLYPATTRRRALGGRSWLEQLVKNVNFRFPSEGIDGKNPVTLENIVN